MRMTTNAVAYPRMWRIFSALLIAMSRASLPFMLIAVLTRTSSITTQMLIRAFTILFAVPGIAAWLVERAFAATVGVTDDTLAIARPERRVEIPPRAIARITPWIVPLPGSGLWVHLRSGRRYGLQVSDPSPLLKALAEMCGTTAPLDHPSVIYARAKHSCGSWRSYHLAFKYIVFGLVPTLPIFRLRQFITYGGTFGLYYQQGLQPYVLEFVHYWVQVLISLVLYAGALRGVAETVALTTAWIARARAATARRIVEIGCRVLYYGGIPAFLLWYFFTD